MRARRVSWRMGWTALTKPKVEEPIWVLTPAYWTVLKALLAEARSSRLFDSWRGTTFEREREIDVIRARAGDGVARSVSEHLAGGEFESESVGVRPVLQMASAGTNGSAGNSIRTDGAVCAAGDFGRGCRDIR